MTDLIIIGAGPGGYQAAVYAAKHGLKDTIFEAGHVGGTCLNVGCIPTKTYVHSASFAEAIERQPQVVEQLRAGVETLLSHPNITLIRGKASFVDAHTVRCVGCDSVAADATFTADNIIIATGSSAKMLPIPGIDDPRVLTSTELLQLTELPRRLCIVGAGVIGMEFASVFSRFGSEVTVIEFLKECLPMLDSDIAKRLRKQLEKRGVTFQMQCGVKSIQPLSNSPRGGEDSPSSEGVAVHFERKGKEESVEADVVLIATGRKANTEGLNLEAAGITLAPNGTIPVDEHFQVPPSRPPREEKPTPTPSLREGSSIRQDTNGNESPSLREGSGVGFRIFAIGDVNGRQMLAHAAEYQGHHVVNQILGIEDHIRFDVMPGAIFTVPEAANVGPSEDQLKADGVPFECHKAFYRANGKALAMGETEGMVKLCTEPGEGRILSAHAFGAHAADLVQEVTAYITLAATLRQLRDTIHIHPTLSEVLIEVS